MSEDLTRKLSNGDCDKRILSAVQNLDTHMRSSFDQLASGIGSVDARLKHLEQKVDERLHDSRPKWHKVVADIAQFQTGQDAIRSEMQELNNIVRTVNRDQIVINDAVRRIQLDFHNLDERLHSLIKHDRQNSST
jgi:hypothetical protein